MRGDKFGDKFDISFYYPRTLIGTQAHLLCYNNRQASYSPMTNTANEIQPTMPPQAEQQKTQAAEAAQGFLQSILDTGREPFLVLDATLNVVTANRAFYRTFATDEAATVGRFVYDLGDGQWDIPVLRRLLEDVLPKEAAFEGYEVTHDFPGVGTKTMRLNGRKLYRLGNHTTMFLLALEDVTGERGAETARREAEELLHAAGERASEVLESIGDAFFALDRDWRFTYVNAQAERLLARRRDSLMGRSVWDEFPEAVGSAFEQQYRRATQEGVTVVFEAHFAPLSAWFEVRAYPSAAGLSVYFHDITAQHEASQHLASAYKTERRRAEREALLNRIGEAIRATDDPAEIQQVAVNTLAEALGADRCYFAQLHPVQGISEITTEYHHPSLPPAANQYSLSDVPSLAGDLYGVSRAFVVPDTQTAGFDPLTTEFLTRLRVRSFVRLPLREGAGQSAALVVAMADAPRDWTPEEVALVEAVATQTRTAVADARVRLREHRIATQLQDALQPPLPESAPGLALSKYYEAALDEAGVGGDFFDVFPISTTCTALVVGDLSGKGLAAAAQVSTVRNMLRATLYLGQSIAEAMINLNNILADNALLTGFATLFVGVYDASSGLLRYVNCGQEPGLVRRASTRKIEMLDPTGPVLGAFPGADFTQEQILLCPGDALALFTDGLTEAGPSRANMLELEGIAALLAGPLAASEDGAAQAEALTLSLIDSVDRFAESGVRDDVCLLVAVATP